MAVQDRQGFLRGDPVDSSDAFGPLVVQGATTTGSGEAADDPTFVNHSTTALGDGRTVVTTAGTRVALAASTVVTWVIITAATANTGYITVGAVATVVAAVGTRRGTPLAAGDSLTLEVDNLADVGLDATVSGEAVTYTYGA